MPHVTCPLCRAKTPVREWDDGRTVKCQACHQKIKVRARKKVSDSSKKSDTDEDVDWSHIDDLIHETDPAKNAPPEPEPLVPLPRKAAKVVKGETKAKKEHAVAEPPLVGWGTILCSPARADLWAEAIAGVIGSVAWSIATNIGTLLFVLPGLIAGCFSADWHLKKLAGVCARACGESEPEESISPVNGLVWLFCSLGPMFLAIVIGGNIVKGNPQPESPAALFGIILPFFAGLMWFGFYTPLSIAAYALQGSPSPGFVIHLMSLCLRSGRWFVDLVLWFILSACINGLIMAVGVVTLILCGLTSSATAIGRGAVPRDHAGVIGFAILFAILVGVQFLGWLMNVINAHNLGLVLLRNHAVLGFEGRPVRSR